ncbi:TetR/AcrR family transcriptional regulator [Nocardia sp. NPDC057272]|uniref:TetR/AcrR family transcriptional regulator n=1 Tax=Nocardia sp. NPDC057272 TaxID=3346079 RepID=UPI0036341628
MTASTIKRSDATRQALLRAARAEFAQYGLAGARVDRIAETAGVNKERIYGLFGSKDRLFDVIIVDTMREFMEVVQPLAETEPGDYVGKLFDYHRDHPQLLRLLLWEGLHRGADAHDVDGWRADHYGQKFDRAQEQFGVDEKQAGRLLLALCGLANWTHAVPQTTRLLLGDAASDTDATREFVKEFARSALRNLAATPEPVAPQPDATLPGPVNALTTPVDDAARRLREAQAAADVARAELATALRTAHAAGAGANQLARRVAGTMSRPLVLKLLTD